MVDPGVYYHLIYYRQNKLIRHLYFALCLIILVILVITLTKYLWDLSLNDVIIVGGGPLAEHFNHKLKKANVRSILILPPRPSYLSLGDWIKKTPREVVFAHDDLDDLSDETGLDLDLLKTCQNKISSRPGQISQPILDYAKTNSLEVKQVYSTTLSSSQPDYMAYVKEIKHEPDLARVTLSTGKTIIARTVFVVDINLLDLAEKYFDLDHPLEALVSSRYLKKGDQCNCVIELNSSTSLLLNGSQAEMLSLTGVDGQYQHDSNPKPIINNYFFNWRQTGVIIIDPCNYPSHFPLRDALIVVEALTSLIGSCVASRQTNCSNNLA